jgi:hypothetical protein
MNERMILPRVSRDETTFAVIEFAGVSRQELKDAVRRAVTAWVRDQPGGRREYENGGGDFNVGDLSNVTNDKSLRDALAKEGVTQLTIDTYCDDRPTGWGFDDHLVDEEEI